MTTSASPLRSPLMRDLLALATQMKEIAERHHPEGNLEVLRDYRGLPYVLQEVLDAIKIMHRRCAEQNLETTIFEYVTEVVKAQQNTVNSSYEIAPAIERCHADEIRHAMYGSERWDASRNLTSGRRSIRRPVRRAV